MSQINAAGTATFCLPANGWPAKRLAYTICIENFGIRAFFLIIELLRYGLPSMFRRRIRTAAAQIKVTEHD
jgi:hypothetical protein